MKLAGRSEALFLFDVGYEIDLAALESRFAGAPARGPERFRHKRPAGVGGALGSPVRLREACEPVRCGAYVSSPTVELAFYGFGAVCVAWNFPFDCLLEELIELSSGLYANRELEQRSRALVVSWVASLAPAIARPLVAEASEDFVVFRVEGPALATMLDDRSVREDLARLLRAERGALSVQEITAALREPIAYSPAEACYVDWFAALLVGADMDDERQVLELAAVELLELRLLEDVLSRGIEGAHDLLARARGGLRAFWPRSAELDRIARMQADYAVLHEGVDNALKLFGDDYLARLYRRAAERFRLDEWDAAVEHKLAGLDSIHRTLSDLASQRRAEVLEWIIIALFGVDIALYLLELR